MGAGVPAAWQIQERLLTRIAAASGEQPDDVFVWWKNRTGRDAEYDELLHAAAPTPLGRKDLLREFFEPTDGEREAGLKVPSAAHRAIAQMMAEGLVRIVVTLNFDLLIETALRDLGIEPTVVSTAADAAGMEPLHAQRHLIWHLHGDYTNPEMLNTPDELRTYPAHIGLRLDEVFDQYGLLVVGWSARWDSALIAALARCSSRRYPTFWLDRFPLNGDAAKLAKARDATVVIKDAGEWLPMVTEACGAIKHLETDPLTTAGAIATVKRDLSFGRIPVGAHDLLLKEVQRIRELQAFSTNEDIWRSLSYHDRIPAIEDELELWAALIATLAYWGNARTDDWWISSAAHLADVPTFAGSSDANNALKVPAIFALYAGGVAAVAAGRWTTVVRLLTDIPVLNPFSGQRSPAAALYKPDDVYPHTRWPSRALFGLLRPVLSDAAGLGVLVEEAWEQFEYLSYALDLARHTEAKAVPFPYVRVDDDRTDSGREVVPVVSAAVRSRSALLDELNAHVDNNRYANFAAALDAADARIGAAVEDAERRSIPMGRAVRLPGGRRFAPIAGESQ
ncbi:SIR2 family protein [Rhodococcus sp. 14-2483-1-1]|uniref:SIR2 family protein n=1 Tax=Rhodococcus sp. 14-2483-1-1 TaxID=2023148 RepID=UPI001483936B|nr:SIR2 family protein [Rhodococcus sp. 14-2483-1-1]